MGDDHVGSGCQYAAGTVFSVLAGAVFGGIAGLFFGVSIPAVVFIAIGGAFVSNRIFSWWWKAMVRAQRSPVASVVLFLLAFIVLSAGLLFMAKDSLR